MGANAANSTISTGRATTDDSPLAALRKRHPHLARSSAPPEEDKEAEPERPPSPVAGLSPATVYSSEQAREEDIATNPFVQANFIDAAKTGKVKLLRKAVEQDGAAINMPCYQDGGWTALHYAAFEGQAAAVRYLLTLEGVDRESKDISGQTPAQVAANPEIAALIRG